MTPLHIYPNPCSGKIKVSFILDKMNDVSIKIYRLNGEIITSKEMLKKPAGIYELPLDLSGFTPGVYLCRFQVNEFVQTKKIVVIH